MTDRFPVPVREEKREREEIIVRRFDFRVKPAAAKTIKIRSWEYARYVWRVVSATRHVVKLYRSGAVPPPHPDHHPRQQILRGGEGLGREEVRDGQNTIYLTTRTVGESKYFRCRVRNGLFFFKKNKRQLYYKCVYTVAYRAPCVMSKIQVSGSDMNSVLAFREISHTCIFGQSVDGGKVARRSTQRFTGNGNNSPKRYIHGGGSYTCPTCLLPGNFAYFTDDTSVYLHLHIRAVIH